jgi:Domain of unknown function (DUF4177)
VQWPKVSKTVFCGGGRTPCQRVFARIILDKPTAVLHQKRMMNHQNPVKVSSNFKVNSRKNMGIRVLMGCSMVLLFATGLEAKQIVWEYRVISVNTSIRALEATLNENGAQGWELVEINTKGVAIFKRQKAS